MHFRSSALFGQVGSCNHTHPLFFLGLSTVAGFGVRRALPLANQTATSIAVGQEPTMRSTNQTAATIATGQEQITRNTDQTATDIDQSPSKPSAPRSRAEPTEHCCSRQRV